MGSVETYLENDETWFAAFADGDDGQLLLVQLVRVDLCEQAVTNLALPAIEPTHCKQLDTVVKIIQLIEQRIVGWLHYRAVAAPLLEEVDDCTSKETLWGLHGKRMEA